MNKKTAKCLVAAAMLTSVMTISHAAIADDWERGEYITTDKSVNYDASTNNFSNYTGPNQGLIINWNPSGAPNGPTVNVTAGSGEIAQFANNKAAGDVGASIFTDYNAETIVECAADFVNNNAPGRAGAVWNNGSMTFKENVSFNGNTVSSSDVDPNLNFGVGGAVVNLDIAGDAGSGSMTFDKNVTFVGNSSSQAGALLQSGSITVKGDAVFVGNNAKAGDGGAVLSGMGGGASVTRTDSYEKGLTVAGNTAAGNGGGYKVSQGTSFSVDGTANFGTEVTIDGKTYKGNTATNGSGGAIYNEGSVELTTSNFANNKANKDGGALLSTGENSSANLGTTTMTGNSATGKGGAIAATKGSEVTIGGGSSITGNSASGEGGAIYNEAKVVLDTTNGDISLSGNKSNNKANDIYSAANSTTEVSGSSDVTIGSGLTAAADSTIDIKGTSDLVINSGVEASIAGSIGTETGASFVNNGTTNFTSTSKLSGNFANNENATMTIAGSTESGKTMSLENSGIAKITSDANIKGSITNDKTLSIAGTVDAEVTNEGTTTVQQGGVLGGTITNDKTLSIAGTVNATVVNDDQTTVQQGGILGGTITNNAEKTLTVNDGGLLTGNVRNDGVLTINGAAGNETTAVSITNNATTNINGSFNGDIDQIYDDATTTFGANSEVTVASGATVEGGTLIVENGASLSGILTVTEAVDVQIKQEATTIVEDGLKVGNGVIAGTRGGMNLAEGTYLVDGNNIGTKLTIAKSTINGVDETSPLTITGDGQLTLSDDVTSNNAFVVNGELKLAPTTGGTLTLKEANAVSGSGEVVVDEIVITKQVLNEETGLYEDKEEHKGIGTVVLQNDNSQFEGNFLQKMGAVIAEAGSKFFGGTNTIESGSVTIQKDAELTASETNVEGGTLNLADGAILGGTGTINITSDGDKFGSVNIYNAIQGNIEDETRPDQTIISASDLNTNGALTYLNADETTQSINLSGGVGLGLFNKTIIDGVESDDETLLSLQSDAGVRHLTLGDGSGINASQITLGQDTSLTYKDNATYFDVNEDGSSRNISLDSNSSLNFANDSSDIQYERVITGDNTTSINKSGNGATVITTALTDFAGSINATGGSLDLANTADANSLNSLTSTNTNLHIASENLSTNGTLTVTGGSITAEANVSAGGAATIEDTVANIVGDLIAYDTLTVSGSELNVGNDIDVTNAATISDTKTVVMGVLTANDDLTVNKGSLDAQGDVTVGGNASIKDSVTNVAGTFEAGSLTVEGGSITAQNTVTVAGDASIKDAVASVAGDFSVADELAVIGSQLSAGANVEADSAKIADSKTSIAGDLSVAGAADISNSALAVAGAASMGDTTVDSSSLTLLKDSTFASIAMEGASALNTPANVAVSGTMELTGGASAADSPIINLTGNSMNEITADKVVVNGDSSIMFDASVRQKGLDTISANEVSGNGHLIITGINITDSPIDRMVNIDISNLLTDKNGSKLSMVKLKDGGVVANTEMGKYLITASGASNILNASLLQINPQMYRGQVATVATYANQLIVNNMLFDHMNILANDLLARDNNANRYAAANPLFAPYQYSKKDGDLWYKAYGAFERISMTQGLNVGNNAYGSIIGADFPVVALKNGWSLVPTGYIAYNGGHQTFNGVSMYQNGAQIGAMGTAYKGNFITSLLAYGGGYGNHMSVNGPVGSGSDDTGNWFAGVASKTAYNIHLPADLILQPTGLVSYNIFGNQNYHSDFGNMSMNSGFLNGINIAPGLNLIWNKKTFSLYATTQLVFNIMGDVSGRAGNIDLEDVRMRTTYFEYGLGAMKRFNDIFMGYLQFTIRNGYRTGIGFQGGLNWKLGKNPKKQK